MSVVALLGLPNSGKSTLFNTLTKSRQRVANFPGITVEKRKGRAQLSSDIYAEILDMPGTYSLTPESLDEKIVA
mgnify:CR=1 FL=1